MQYMILIHSDPAAWDAMPPAEMQEAFDAYMKYNRDLAMAGVIRSGGQLAPAHTGTTLRSRGGTVETTDGPFAESREQLGGFYVIEVEDLDAALAWAGRCPAIYGGGAIEVRPLVVIPE